MCVLTDCYTVKCGYEESSFYWHEALDRSSLATDFFHQNIEEHPAIQHDAELKKEAEKITGILADFYQKVGEKSYAFDNITSDLKQLIDRKWYWVEYEGLGEKDIVPAMYREDVDCFYSYNFSGVPRRNITVLRET